MVVEKVSGPVVIPEQVPSVVKTAAVVKKQSGLKRLWKGFFAEDIKTVGGNITENVVKPTIKNGIFNILTSALSMWLFGKNSNYMTTGGLFRPLFNNNNNSLINYNNMYKVQNGVITQPNSNLLANPNQGINVVNSFRSTDVYDPNMFVYASWQDSENVFISLCQRISQYGVATVRNLYDFSGASAPDLITMNWGWYDLPNHQTLARGDGTWILKLPQPVYLSNK